MSKGSKRRPENKASYDVGYDRIQRAKLKKLEAKVKELEARIKLLEARIKLLEAGHSDPVPTHLETRFLVDVDGFTYFWPESNRGHFAAHHLRKIAMKLDEINAPFEKEMNEFFDSLEQEHK